MSPDQPAQLLPGAETGPAAGQPQSPPPRTGDEPGRPPAVTMPAGWWDSPPVVGCPLSRGAPPDPGHAAGLGPAITC